MSKMMGNLIDSRMKASWRMLEEWQSTIYSMMVFGATMVVMFWASVFLYTSFYFTYMPQESITWPIHLQYKSCGDQPGICSFPNSLVSVTDPSRGSLLARGQKYRVVLDLEMPESPTNQQSGTGLTQLSGMFLITMEMRSFTGDVLRKASRSSMLRYKSPLLQAMSTFIFAPFLLYGAHEEKQLVTAELFSQYEEDPVTPLSDVYIELGSRNIEVYSAQLRIHATFAGLRHFMYYYPLTAAVFGIGVCMVFLSLIVLFSWYQFSMPVEKMVLGPGGHPNGRLTVEDISKEDFEKDAKEGTDDSRRTSSASETSYSPAQMETDTKVEGSGWTSLFSHVPSSPNQDTNESDKTSRRSSRNISAFVTRQNSVPNASCSSSRRSSARYGDNVPDTSTQRKSSFFESIVGALSTPEKPDDDIQHITLEVPPVRSRHSSVSSAKDDSTSKRSSWIFGGDDIEKKKESGIDDNNTNKEIGSRKASWRSSWFGGDIDTLDTNEEPEIEKFTSSKHSSRRSSFHNDETQDELLQQTESNDDKEVSLSSKHASWRSSWFGGDSDTVGAIDESEKEKHTSSKPSSRRSSFRSEEPKKEKNTSSKPSSRKPSFFSDETQEELLQQTSIGDKEESSVSKRSSWRSSWFGGELQDEPVEQLEGSDSKEGDSSSNRLSWFGGDNKTEDADEDNGSVEDDSLKIPTYERKPSIIETMFGISFNPEKSTENVQDDVLEVPKNGARSHRSSVGSLKSNTEQHEFSSMPESSYTSNLGYDLDTTTSVDHSSPKGSRKSSTIGYLSAERRPSFLESMMGMMINPNDPSIQQSHTEEETEVLEVPDNESRRSSRDSTRIDRKGSYNEDETNVHEYRRNSHRSSRGSPREEVLNVPVIKSSSRRSSTGSFRSDNNESNGRRVSKDVAVDDAERLLQDANLVLRRKSSIKDSSIKRVSYLLDEGSHSPRRRRSSTSEYVSQSLDSENNLYPSKVEVNTRRKSSTSFIKQLLTEPSDNDEVEVKKTSRSPSRDDSMYRRSSTTKKNLDTNEEEFNAKISRSTSDGDEVVHRQSQSSSPRPLSGRLSYLFQESETENLALPPAVPTERRPSFIESMMGFLGGGGEGGITAQSDYDNQEDAKE